MKDLDPVSAVFTIVLVLSIFMAGHFVGKNESRQAAPCVNQCVGTKTVWDAENKMFSHAPIMKCLKPGVKQ